MESHLKEIRKSILINEEEFILIIKIIDNKIQIILKNEESIDYYEREFSFKELSEYRAFSICDTLEDIFYAFDENLKNNNNLSLKINNSNEIEFFLEFLILTKKINVIFTISKKVKDPNFINEYILEELKRLKRENIEIRKMYKELREEFINSRKSKN